nr:hypothetical protein [Mariniflexile sp. KMM 9835]
FTQEKAIYKRELETLDRIEALANIAHNQKQPEVAKDIFEFIIENTQEIDIQINAHYNLLKIETEQAEKEDYDSINKKYLDLLNTYGKTPRTVNLQIA